MDKGEQAGERVKELVRQHWNRRAADFDLEASHGLLTDAQAHASTAMIYARAAGAWRCLQLGGCLPRLKRH
jgi:hypothetical protein